MMALPAVTKERVAVQLTDLSLNFGDDADGNIEMLFPNFLATIVVTEGMLHAWCLWGSKPIDGQAAVRVAEFVNEAHRHMMLAKLVVFPHASGEYLQVRCELSVPTNKGMSDAQIADFIHAALSCFDQMCNQLDERFPELVGPREEGE